MIDGDALFLAADLPEWYQGGELSSAHGIDSIKRYELPLSYVLFCYPRDYTPVCTKELVMLQQATKKFQEKGYDLFVASTDSPEVHNLFFNDETAFPVKKVPNMEFVALTLRPYLLTDYGNALLLNEFSYANRVAVVVKNGKVKSIYQTDNDTPRSIEGLLSMV